MHYLYALLSQLGNYNNQKCDEQRVIGAISFMTFRSKEKQKMCYSKVRNSNRITTLLSLFLICLFMSGVVLAQSKDKIDQIKTKDVSPKTPIGYIMVADVLDEFGGEAQCSSGIYKMKMSSGGQPSPIGRSQSASFDLSAGYVGATFVLHGDANGNGVIELGDIVYLIAYLYKGGPAPQPMEAGDCNCSGYVDLGDVVYLIAYLYKNGPPPCDP